MMNKKAGEKREIINRGGPYAPVKANRTSLTAKSKGRVFKTKANRYLKSEGENLMQASEIQGERLHTDYDNIHQ